MVAVAGKVDLEQFQEQGYLVVKGLLDVEKDIQPLVEEYTSLLDSLAERWYQEGKLSSDYRG